MLRRPDFFIVGAPKCGTTAMAQYLASHPDIFLARKEMHRFGADLRFGAQFYRRSPEAYLAEFDAWSGQRRAGEASVWYLFSKLAAAELKAFNPEARIIIMLREPVEMLHSLYYSFRWDGNEHLPTFAEALAAEHARRAGRRLDRRAYFAQGLVYRETARFTEQVRSYFQVFGRERVRVILYDDLLADAGATYRKTLEFLEVDPAFARADFKVINGNKAVKSAALRSIMMDPLVRSAVLAIRPLIPRAVFNGLQRVDARIRRMNSRTAGRVALAPELRRQLQREFAPEVERLSQLLGRDLTHWNNEHAGWPAAREKISRGRETAAETLERIENLA